MTSWTSTYPVGRPQRVCSATGRTLAPGEHTFATLIDNPATNQIERHDYSPEAWNNPAGKPVDERLVIGCWKTTVPASDEKPKPILDDESMLDLFNQTDGSNPQRAALRLVLALLLIRRRILSHEGNKGTTMLLRPRGTPRPPEGPALIEVPDPGVAESTINEVLMELEGLSTGDAAQPAAQEQTS